MRKPKLIANVKPLGRRRWHWEVKHFRADVIAYGVTIGNRKEAAQVAEMRKREMSGQ